MIKIINILGRKERKIHMIRFSNVKILLCEGKMRREGRESEGEK